MKEETYYPEIQSVMGINLSAVEAGVRYSDRKDLAMICFDTAASVSAVFTQNRFCAAPVLICKEHLKSTSPQCLIINSGNANAGTGAVGLKSAQTVCAALAEKMNLKEEAVLPFSTGVIGEMLPVSAILKGLDDLCENLDANCWNDVAEAILTTDTCPKGISVKFKVNGRWGTISGIAKGSGMIQPNMATMLAYVATDLSIEQALLDKLFKRSVNQTLNRITIDGDTSTNDAAVLIATSKSELPPLSAENTDKELLVEFENALSTVMEYLAKAIVKDGEGATKFVEITVIEGASELECTEVAYTVAHSPLVKTALYASDPNWGRILAAIGRAKIDYIDLNNINITINDVVVVRGGAVADDYTESRGIQAMSEPEIKILISLGAGSNQATVWTCDLSHEYVTINSDYRS